MKAMSKMFLIISVIIAVVGGALMITGSVMAKKQGIQLYPEKVDGKYIYTLDLSDKEINKISIDATDADIEVHTGSEKEYIEFINFNENYYSISTTNKVVKFEERVSLESIISFWDGNYSFKGVRSILNLGGYPDGKKEVHIYLKSTSLLNIFSFSITDGNITVKNADSNTDYVITMDSGCVTMENVSTDSKVMINGNKCDLRFKNCKFKYFASDIADVIMKADISNVHSFEFTGKSGTLDSSITVDSELLDVRISSEGPFTYNEKIYNTNYSNNDKTVNITEEFAIVHIDGTDINIKTDVKVQQLEEKSEETTESTETSEELK